jgi:hypothetical protein
MDRFQLAIAVMAITDTHWGPRDADGRRRQFTADELDDMADWGWHLPDLKGVMATCAQAMRWRWRPRANNRLDPTPLPSAATTSHG